MGDVGYFDQAGRLWFCGRKTQRLQTASGPMYTEQVEPVFNVHPRIRRTALVGVGPAGKQRPVLCIELHAAVSEKVRTDIVEELRQVAKANSHTASIDTFLCHPAFPVDIRHNAKIGREKLAAWATKQLK